MYITCRTNDNRIHLTPCRNEYRTLLRNKKYSSDKTWNELGTYSRIHVAKIQKNKCNSTIVC